MIHEVYYGLEDDGQRDEDDCRSIHRLRHRRSERNPADLLTKALSVQRTWTLMHLLQMVEFE